MSDPNKTPANAKAAETRVSVDALKWTDAADREGSGDHVACNDCDWVGVVAHGREECPGCKTDGCMSWADENRQEVSA